MKNSAEGKVSSETAMSNNGVLRLIGVVIKADPYFSEEANYYNKPVHKKGRGAGGHCFIKDLELLKNEGRYRVSAQGRRIIRAPPPASTLVSGYFTPSGGGI